MNIKIEFINEHEISVRFSESFIKAKKSIRKGLFFARINHLITQFIDESRMLKENAYNIFKVDLRENVQDEDIIHIDHKIERELDFIAESEIKISDLKREKKELIKQIKELKIKLNQASLF